MPAEATPLLLPIWRKPRLMTRKTQKGHVRRQYGLRKNCHTEILGNHPAHAVKAADAGALLDTPTESIGFLLQQDMQGTVGVRPDELVSKRFREQHACSR